MLSSPQYHAAFASHPTGTFLVSPAPEATILEVNNAGLALSLRPREDVIGQSIFEAFPPNPADPGEAGQTALRHSLARVVASGKPDILAGQRYPIHAVLPNGDVGFRECFWNIVATPVYADDGSMWCIAVSSTDITEQVRSSRAQDQSEARLRALTIASSDVVYRMSPDWTQMWELDGRGVPENTSGARAFWLEDLVPPEDHALVHRAIENAIGTKTVFELEHRVRRADGSYGWTLSRAVPMLDGRGEIHEWIGAATDITDRKQSEERLLLADLRKDEFLAVLAHELRNPLAPIGGAAELLRLVSDDEARVRQISEVISRQVLHMTGLVDDLLDVARVAQGAVELINAPLTVGGIIADAVEQVAPLIRSRGHTLEIDVPPDAVQVLGDKQRLVQVVANLVNNAAKYTPGGGTILVRAAVQGTDIVVEVIDDGIGMTPDMAARAFDLFSQAVRTSDRSSGGLGLGLALVKNLVELHRGTVGCASHGLGMGSTFAVRLPRLYEQASTAPLPDMASTTDSLGNPLRIMLVDEDVNAASTTAMLLEASGHQVLVEHEAHRALERARAVVPHVFLLDTGLREMEGHELARRLREQPETSRSLLIGLTRYGRENNRREAFLSDFDRHLAKPVNTRVLTQILAEIRSA